MSFALSLAGGCGPCGSPYGGLGLFSGVNTELPDASTITDVEGGGGYPGAPSLSGLDAYAGTVGLGALGAFGAIRDRRKGFIRKLAERIAGKGTIRKSYYSKPSNRHRALQNIYQRRLVMSAGRPLFRTPLDPQEWIYFVSIYRKLRPEDKIPGRGRPARKPGRPDSPAPGPQVDDDGTGGMILIRPEMLGELPMELDAVRQRLNLLETGIKGRMARLRGAARIPMQVRLSRVEFALQLCDAGLKKKTVTSRQAVRAAVAKILAAPITYDAANSTIRVQCGTFGEYSDVQPSMGGFGGLSELANYLGANSAGNLGLYPGAAYAPGAGMPVLPQMAAGYLPTSNAAILRHTFDRISQIAIPGDRPGAVQVPMSRNNNLPDAIAGQQPRPPFRYPTAPMTGVTIMPNGMVLPAPRQHGRIPAAVNPALGPSAMLPARLPVVGGPSGVSGYAGFDGFGAAGNPHAARDAAGRAVLAWIYIAAQEKRALFAVSAAIKVRADDKAKGDKKKAAVLRRIMTAAIRTVPASCSAAGARFEPFGPYTADNGSPNPLLQGY